MGVIALVINTETETAAAGPGTESQETATTTEDHPGVAIVTRTGATETVTEVKAATAIVTARGMAGTTENGGEREMTTYSVLQMPNGSGVTMVPRMQNYLSVLDHTEMGPGILETLTTTLKNILAIVEGSPDLH